MPDQRVFTSLTEGDPTVITAAGHALAPGILIASFAGFLPAVGALVAIIFYCIQIFESDTVQKWRHSRRLRKIAAAKVELDRLLALELVAHPVNVGQVQLAQATAASVVERATNTAAQVLEAAKTEGK